MIKASILSGQENQAILIPRPRIAISQSLDSESINVLICFLVPTTSASYQLFTGKKCK
ncbi:hypothetical protein MICAE_90010 [Microcystis aeruginosa PCC 9806]|uniref:Uncharacterized protein n=1 Tax=Microcystis aeruginosa PCC 9806 TaxID=1160282 RepID=I4H385_MICAE|nr:hypothetical protein MICAE_90010 [Microcystis aeruginosa PCC 9806]